MAAVLAAGFMVTVSSSASAATPSVTLPTPYSELPANPAVAATAHRPGLALTPQRAIADARRDPRIAKIVAGDRAFAFADYLGHSWAVSYYRGTTLVAGAQVSDPGGRVIAFATGAGATAALAGKPLFWEPENAWWLMGLLGAACFLAFFDPRRPFRRLHLDLLVLLGLGGWEVLANQRDIWLMGHWIYPLLGYLLIRTIYAGFRPLKDRGPLVPMLPMNWLLIGIVLFMGLRIGLAVASPSVFDPGAASVAGAHDISHGMNVYGHVLRSQVRGGDAYGPINYLAYVPFERIFPWHPGASPPYAAGKAAVIFFDLVVLMGMLLLGRRLKPGREGRKLGVALGYAWAAFPPAAFVLNFQFNDGLVAALLVLSVVLIGTPRGRGALIALASLAKIFPLALVPLFAFGAGPRSKRALISFAAVFSALTVVILVPFLSGGGLHEISHFTLNYQLTRADESSFWARSGTWKLLKDVLELATVGFALSLALWPRTRSVRQVAALAAAVVIAIEITLGHWFLSYAVWFAPLVLAALFAESAQIFRTRSTENTAPPVVVQPAESPRAYAAVS